MTTTTTTFDDTQVDELRLLEAEAMHIADAGVVRAARPADLAALSDGLRAEREQGITIDVAYRFFSTDTHSYILADTPGHERCTRNMFTGASTLVAILLVDDRRCVAPNAQTRPRREAPRGQALRRDGQQDRSRRLRHRPFGEVKAQLALHADRLGGLELTVIPIAAEHGDNVVHRSERTPWYDGPSLLECSENIELSAPQPVGATLRLPVQWVSRPVSDQRRRYTGRLSAEPREVKPGAATRNDVRWHPTSLDRDYRWGKTGQRGATVWFTGLPASGKSTVAVAVERALVESGRDIARRLGVAAKLPFIEVHVSTPLTECERPRPQGPQRTGPQGRTQRADRSEGALRAAGRRRAGHRHHGRGHR